MTTTTDNKTLENRKVRIEQIIDEFDIELSMVDDDLQSDSPPRYVVLEKSDRGFGTTLIGAESMGQAEELAGQEIHEAWWPECCYDLDELIGDEPRAEEGDIVRFSPDEGEPCEYVVERVEEDLIEGMIARHLILNKVDSDANRGWDDYDHRIDDEAYEFEFVERLVNDERTPCRYDIAVIKTVVGFNTKPEKS